MNAALKILTQDLIFAARDLKTETVPVPAWGGAVIVSEMSGAAREAFLEKFNADRMANSAAGRPNSDSEFQARTLVASVVNEDGSPLFTDPDAVKKLMEKQTEALVTVLSVAMRINGFGAQAVAAAEKNSEKTPNDSSGTDSQ